jgi:hypothetical protein
VVRIDFHAIALAEAAADLGAEFQNLEGRCRVGFPSGRGQHEPPALLRIVTQSPAPSFFECLEDS